MAEYRGTGTRILDRVFRIFESKQGNGMAHPLSASNSLYCHYRNRCCIILVSVTEQFWADKLLGPNKVSTSSPSRLDG